MLLQHEVVAVAAGHAELALEAELAEHLFLETPRQAVSVVQRGKDTAVAEQALALKKPVVADAAALRLHLDHVVLLVRWALAELTLSKRRKTHLNTLLPGWVVETVHTQVWKGYVAHLKRC